MGRMLQNLLNKAERPDDSTVGITFVDVLFALVIGQILIPVADGLEIPWPGKTQLLLAFILTVTSWIGYHNSQNRPRFSIRFLNLPLAQFAIDVSLVIAYWLTATWVEGLPLSNSPHPSALPESILVSVCFLLYVLWDVVGSRIRRSGRYGEPLGTDAPIRRRVSGFFFFATSFTTLMVYAGSSTTSAPVVAVDLWLIFILILYRLAKEALTPIETQAIAVEKNSN